MKRDINKVLVRAQELQKEMHAYINNLAPIIKSEKKNITYEDLVVVYLLMKISQLEDAVSSLDPTYKFNSN